ncbi:hypothetical protein GGD81_000263 [Rhodobium orientis]|uniref:Addiction module toxin, HicA family n=1 Tax=Rhodobium orientis TaxID=34017 RepID=A0A327JTY9_9HYPH|nr:type II toxin-antitoxin system HicA family toxin [Rhodobium orientis]MBB4301248.1 hypothetical protein [Rhodobium orientis]MBK5951161.1 hypothetical protein [Rhodobium orientis]RAI29990.1 hypothetical protein CH339_00180 [Rhodobium orientis]
MTKDQKELIRELRRLAGERELRVEPGRGKGSHIRVYLDGRVTTIPAKVKTGTRRAILKQLGLA